jgi:cation transport protein ChaC
MQPRSLSLTPELVALCERPEPDLGGDPNLTPITVPELDALEVRLTAELAGGPLWLFAYGSLIWRPDFTFVEQRRGTVHGWHRSFCLELTTWRGSRQQPGLMMALDRGGRCAGVAYRLPPGNEAAQIRRLLEREITVREDLGMVRWVTAQTHQGACRCLVFFAGPKGKGIALKLPLERVAAILASACGHGGSCAAYLYNTVVKLEEIGIRDRNLWRLQAMTAAEIRRIHAARLAAG